MTTPQEWSIRGFGIELESRLLGVSEICFLEDDPFCGREGVFGMAVELETSRLARMYSIRRSRHRPVKDDFLWICEKDLDD